LLTWKGNMVLLCPRVFAAREWLCATW
jgi:hypothetical protein